MEKEVQDIIKKIANIQIEATKRIQKDPQDNDTELLQNLLKVEYEEEAFIEDVIRVAKDREEVYTNILDNPNLIKGLDEYQLHICSHILFRMEDEWINDNVDGVIGTWSLLNKLIGKFHPEFKLVIC